MISLKPGKESKSSEHHTENVEDHCSNTPTSVCLLWQDAGGIDWGDSEAAPIEIEIVDAGTDCNYVSY